MLKKVEILECDRYGCRRRKDVGHVKISIEAAQVSTDPVVFEGDLCAYHRQQLFDRISDQFRNTKE
jgi:hypothetical protein|tara:strand:+ start:105 stop:302 length:198 start_codon:yes stop_codon:yes gene_type:complete